MNHLDGPTTDPRPLRRIVTTTFIALVGFGMMIPMLPLYARQFGATGVTVGLLFSLNQLVDFFFAPVAGRLSDRIGRRPLLLGALGLTAAAYLLVGLAGSMGVLLVVWTLAGFGSSQVLLTQAYIADVTDERGRTRGMGLWGAAYAVGFVIGPPLGAVLFERSPLLAGVVASIFGFGALLYAALRLPEPDTHSVKETARVSILREMRFVVVAVIGLYFILIFSWSGLTSMLALFTRDVFSWTTREYGMYLGGLGMVAAVLQAGLVGRMAPRWGNRFLVMLGFLLLGMGLLALVKLPGGLEQATSAVLIAMGLGLLMPTLPAVLSLRVTPRNRGQALGLLQSASTLARVFAPLVAGALYDGISPSSPFIAGGLIALIAAAGVLPALRRRAR